MEPSKKEMVNAFQSLVGIIGFEPMTSRSQSEHSTKLN